MNSSTRPLRILILAAEAVPFVKTGEVAEVISSLAKALQKLGHDVRLVIPRYSHISLERFGLQMCIPSLPVAMNSHTEMAQVYSTALGQVPIYLVDNPRYFGRDTTYMHVDDAERFVFYARAALELVKHPQVAWQPDVIHCHDWQTAIVPNWLTTLYKEDPFYDQTATVFTIHRLAHQGIFGYRLLEVAGLEEYGFIYHSAIGELSDLVDLMARGIYYADAVTTVSECYAREIQTPEFGERLDPILREKDGRLFGVRNGIDTELLDPATDPYIAARYDAAVLERRAPNKAALQRLAGLTQDAAMPLIGMISRLSDIKGFDLLAAMFELLMAHTEVQFMILGVGEPKYHDLLARYAKRYPGRVGLQLTFNDALERQICAGSDMFLMPSQVEPCGLGQMIAMRYGCVPVVRATGGLVDTVQDYDPRTGRGNGFAFQAYDALALYTTVVRAIEVYKHHDLWQALQKRCMAGDFSWTGSAQCYVDIYRRALDLRTERPTQPSSGVFARADYTASS
jgi:starch synthase